MHKCETDDYKVEGNQQKIWDGYWNEWVSFEINYCPFCGKSLQPERLNPEDVSFNTKTPVHDWGKLWNVCDSPNSDNK
jgi:hypothetical protein